MKTGCMEPSRMDELAWLEYEGWKVMVWKAKEDVIVLIK